VSEWRKQAEQVYDEARRLAPDHPMVLLLGAGAGLGPEDYWVEKERVLKQVQGAVPDCDYCYGVFLLYTGRARAALEPLKRARQNDPLNGLIAVNLAEAYANTGNIRAYREELERAATLPNAPQWVIALNALQFALAANDLQAIHTLTQTPLGIDDLTRAINREMGPLAGDKPTLRAALKRAWSDPANRTVFGSLMIAVWFAYAGDPDLALEALNTVVDAYTYTSAQIWTFSDSDITHRTQWRPLMREVRRLPGFKDLVRKLGLAGYWRATGNWGEFCRPVSADDFECE
jgi:tetratricopeptide (TPR) repeat protein